MKKATVFKTLIDILFFGLCLGLLSILFVMPFGLNIAAQESKDINSWGVFSWVIFILSVVSYILLIIGVKYLRNAARYMLKSDMFNTKIPYYLKNSGYWLIMSSILSYLIFIMAFLKQLGLENRLNISFDSNLLLQMMITAVGLFFIIQSDTLKRGIHLKKENDLTI